MRSGGIAALLAKRRLSPAEARTLRAYHAGGAAAGDPYFVRAGSRGEARRLLLLAANCARLGRDGDGAGDDAAGLPALWRRFGAAVAGAGVGAPPPGSAPARAFAAVLADLDGHPARFVQVSWRPSWRDAGEDWKAAEAREAAEDLAALAWTAAGEDQSPGIDDFEETT